MAAYLEAWEHDSAEELDPRLEHKRIPNSPVSLRRLRDLGVLNWTIDVENWPNSQDPIFEKIKMEKGYNYSETIEIAPGLMDNFEEKMARFFQEHLHPYDESRLILEGSGFWDIRDFNGEWIRFRVKKGDMIALPPGMYHRFTLDTHNYIKALLLFADVPTRVDVMRPHGDTLQARKDYVQSTLMKIAI